jgi:hypothetical protein
MLEVSCHWQLGIRDIRRSDDDFGIDQLLVESGVLAVLIRRRDQRVTLVLEPFADAELVLGCA